MQRRRLCWEKEKRDGRSLRISERKELGDGTGEASGDWLRYYRPHALCYVSEKSGEPEPIVI